METRVLPFTEQAIEEAAALILTGEPVAVATETVYGLAADATDAKAVARIYEAKGRPSFNPLTVAKAYQGFQDEGLIVVKRGVGMFVAPGARARLGESERYRFLKEEWPEIRARMRRLGISAAELLERESA